MNIVLRTRFSGLQRVQNLKLDLLVNRWTWTRLNQNPQSSSEVQGSNQGSELNFGNATTNEYGHIGEWPSWDSVGNFRLIAPLCSSLKLLTPIYLWQCHESSFSQHLPTSWLTSYLRNPERLTQPEIISKKSSPCSPLVPAASASTSPQPITLALMTAIGMSL